MRQAGRQRRTASKTTMHWEILSEAKIIKPTKKQPNLRRKIKHTKTPRKYFIHKKKIARAAGEPAHAGKQNVKF